MRYGSSPLPVQVMNELTFGVLKTRFYYLRRTNQQLLSRHEWSVRCINGLIHATAEKARVRPA
jgi:hypothetical protein